ncbi:hypothetical protein MMC08_001409 [Hypocenomyce scalaris]|nr:hypothetical protein [Hypocenomyce scalaris]
MGRSREVPIYARPYNSYPPSPSVNDDELSTACATVKLSADATVENTGTEEDSMTTPNARPERVYHQDYIARIRYNNSLPPPPGAPKLLNIPTDGLAHYTSAAFASRLAREQPLNIEADAEMGMPIDLVGMPGIFDGDESSIQAPLHPPPVHPRDKALLRPLASLGKPKFAASGVSFLRRTEYISSEQGRSRVDPNKNLAKSGTVRKKKPVDASKDDPINVLRSVLKGFDIAHPEDAYKGPDNASDIRGDVPTPAETDAWNNPKHPSKPALKLLDSYPVLPDLDAFTDANGYVVAKFATAPTHATDSYDSRMEVGLLHPLDLDPEVAAELEAKRIAHEVDPVKNPPPGHPPYNYEFFLPDDATTAENVKKMFDVDDPDNDDASLYTYDDKDARQQCFRYSRLRTYETGLQSGNAEKPYNEVALALHDPELADQMAHANLDGSKVPSDDRLEKAAYYYPILQKMQLKPRRSKNIAQLGMARRNDDEEAEGVDVVDLVIGEPNEAEVAKRSNHRAGCDVKTADEA